jgi:hypothetical protein
LLYTWCTTITPRQLIADSSSSSNKRKKTAMWRCCGYQLNFQSQQATEIFKPSNGPSTTQRGPTKGTRSHSKTSNTEFGIGPCQPAESWIASHLEQLIILLSSSVHKCRRFGRPTNNDSQCASLRYNQSFPFHQLKQLCLYK